MFPLFLNIVKNTFIPIYNSYLHNGAQHRNHHLLPVLPCAPFVTTSVCILFVRQCFVAATTANMWDFLQAAVVHMPIISKTISINNCERDCFVNSSSSSNTVYMLSVNAMSYNGSCFTKYSITQTTTLPFQP